MLQSCSHSRVTLNSVGDCVDLRRVSRRCKEIFDEPRRILCSLVFACCRTMSRKAYTALLCMTILAISTGCVSNGRAHEDKLADGHEDDNDPGTGVKPVRYYHEPIGIYSTSLHDNPR